MKIIKFIWIKIKDGIDLWKSINRKINEVERIIEERRIEYDKPEIDKC